MANNKITPETIQAVLVWREQYPKATWQETGEHFGYYGERLRLACRDDGTPTPKPPIIRRKHRGPRPQYDANAVASFYLGEGNHEKPFTAKRFGITTWYVNTALIEAGYPDEACPSIVATHNSHPALPQDTEIATPKEESPNGTFKDLLLAHVAYVTSLETKVATLEQNLKAKGTSNQRIAEIAAKLEYELAHRE